MKRIIVSAALFAFCMAGSAKADWQFTKWGMSPGDLVAASPNPVYETTAKERKAKRDLVSGSFPALKSPWKSGDFDFTAFFDFEADGGGLSHVTLQLDRGLALAVVGALRTKYGEPDTHDEGVAGGLAAIGTWNVEGDRISYMRIGKKISVNYKPRESANTSGL
jgi:hypothetical protein